MAETGIPREESDPACATAHGEAPAEISDRTLVAVFSSPVAGYLLRYGADLGFRAVLVEPDPERAAQARRPEPGVAEAPELVTEVPGDLDGSTDVVVTDHHRDELGPVLRDLLGGKPRWIGVMGNPRHFPPHVRALTQLGVPASDIARVHRPVGLNIGSRTPPEIAIAALAGLIADRNARPGGFVF
jgi:xanthine dehydrogenase accessory factor